MRIEVGEKRDDEVSLWSVAVGNLPIPFIIPKKTKLALKFIQEQEGFVAFYPMYPHGTLCLFKTKNDAKGARNMMRFKGIQVGDNICEVYVKKEYVDRAFR